MIADGDNALTGTVTLSTSSTTINGFGTRFRAELKEGDIVVDEMVMKELLHL